MAEDSPQELKSKRGIVKAKLTRLTNFIQSIDRESLNIEIISNLQVRLDKIEPAWDEFNEFQSKIEVLASSQDDETEREQFEISYFATVGKIKALMREFEVNVEMSEEVNSGRRSHITNNSNNNNRASRSLVKLPPIKLPTFDGQYCNWLEFKEVFVALVDQDESLSPIEKFYYLKTCLSDTVKEKIEVSATKYDTVWKFLLDRYENKQLIIHNHIHAIFELPTLNKESHVELRNLYDNVNKHLRALTNLGEKTDCWDRLIIYILTNKFDPATRRGWESHKCKQDLPNLQDVYEFLKERCEMLEKIELTRSKSDNSNNNKLSFNKAYNKNQGYNKRSHASNTLASTTENKNYKCYFCNNGHSIFKCEEFLKLNPNNRITEIKRLRLCLNCLRPSHPSWKCNLSKCLKCKKAHNTILHSDSLRNNNENSMNTSTAGANSPVHVPNGPIDTQEGTSVTLNAQATTLNCSQVLLSTALIKIKTKNNTWITCRALLDSASQSHFITENLCNKLDLPKLKLNHSVKGVGQTLTNINNQVDVSIMSCYNNFTQNVRCLVLCKITDKLPTMSFNKNMLKIPANWQLADPNFNISSDIDMLLGSNVFWEILCRGQERLGPNAPILQNTQFGWVVAGNLQIPLKLKNTSVSCCTTNSSQESIDDKLTKFWTLEEVLNKKSALSVAEKFCEVNFEATTTRDSTGRFIVNIPFKNTIQKLGDSYAIARKRFELLERKLLKNAELKAEYCTFMAEYEQLGHMSKIEEVENFNYSDGYFLPHHAVLKKESLTTKCRVVFDSSAKTSSGLSLNDVQFIGPTLQQDVFSILARFRTYKYVMTGDISKMYRQILINKEQRKYQRILWRAEPGEKQKIFEINRIVYGNASSPYLAVRCLFQLAYENENKFPEVSEVIKRDFYMDDLLTGANSVEDILKIQFGVSEILSSAGFDLRKWLCNNKEILKQFRVNNELDVSILEIGENEQNKTLGVYWDSNKDIIKYKLNTNNRGHNKITKRIILSVTCQIFDPLGLLGPIIITAKLIMQELWKLKLQWDENVPTDLARRWQSFQNDLSGIGNLEIPRQAVLSEYIKIELHGFADASEKAYSACTFVRCIMSSGKIVSNVLCAKSRVAPIKQISLPRLELCGAVLLANLTYKVTGILNVKFNEYYYWTDSMIVLAWIRGSPNKWKTFVANRVSEIQTMTDISAWRHVSSSDNPADLPSRGVSINNLKDCDLWWHGPTWFEKDNSTWKLKPNFEIPEDIPEQRTVSCVAINGESDIIKGLINKHSSLLKLLRITAYVLRFVANIKVKNKRERVTGTIMPEELETAVYRLLKQSQIESFPRDYHNLENKKNAK